MEDDDLDPASRSTQQSSQLPHKDSEPPAQSPECEGGTSLGIADED